MTDFIIRELQVEEPEANQLRMAYWSRYGATLTGLVRHHGIDPHHFLADTHHFPDLAKILRHDHATNHLLNRLPGRKILFSNGPARYARSIIRAMGIERHFDNIYAIEHLKFRPKPQIPAYLKLLGDLRVTAGQCVLVEDTAANLKPAKAMGMTTVWLNAGTRRPPHVDIMVKSLRELIRRFAHGQPL